MSWTPHRLMNLVPHVPSTVSPIPGKLDYFNAKGERLDREWVRIVACAFIKYLDREYSRYDLAATIRRNLGPDSLRCFCYRWEAANKRNADIYEYDFEMIVRCARPYQPGRAPSLNSKGQRTGGYSGGFGS